jgi:hypothetical protein
MATPWPIGHHLWHLTNMLIVKSDLLFKTVLKGYSGITIFPFIFVNDKSDKTLIAHEKVHYWQQLAWLIIPFFIWYLIQYLFYLIKFRNADLAYLSISFERDAYVATEGYSGYNQRVRHASKPKPKS